MRIEHCPAAQLASLYQHCVFFICPTLYTGTGITVLYGMRAGARVLAGRVGAIPEVAGNIPLYFNPESVDSIRRAVRRALDEDPKKREQLSKVAPDRTVECTWERCAWKTLSAFKRI